MFSSCSRVSCIAVLSAIVLFPGAASAQIGAAAERVATRAAVAAAERQAAERAAKRPRAQLRSAR